MKHEISLYELGREYEDSARLLYERVAELRTGLPLMSADERKSTEYRILLMLAEARNCRKTAKHLMNYYGVGEMKQ